jgi:ABC-2 type transport system permease protein
MNWIGLYTFIHREVARMFRVPTQTLVAPWVSAFLFIFIFGEVIGSRIGDIQGVPYINFVLPGVLMLNVLTAAFSHASSSLYFARFTRSIEEILVAPLSHLEMIVGYITGAVIRGLIVAVGVLGVGLAFGAVQLENIFIFLFYIIAVSIAFGLLGMLVGFWAKGFEQLNAFPTFLITPLSFLGGVFYSISMLPENFQAAAKFNPFFYFIDGIRYSMTGISEGNLVFGTIFISLIIIASGVIIWYLFEIGWRIRE